MKKLMTITMLIMAGLAGLLGCGGASLPDAGFTEVSEGSYTLVDTESSPLPQGGLKIDVVTGPEGYTTFTVTDDKGTETADYYTFTPATNIMLRHRYVAAMGMTYNYHFDLTAMELLKVTDADAADVTESLKMGGRWDGAAAETQDHAQKLMDYFEASYGVTICDAVGK